jgi:hypothetical protein
MDNAWERNYGIMGGLMGMKDAGGQTAKPPTKEKADGFALSPLDSTLQALPRNAPSGLSNPAAKRAFSSPSRPKRDAPSPTEEG